MSRKPLGNAIPIAINKYINTAYDTILLVAQNLDTIKAVADQVTYLNTYLGESDTPPTKRPNGDPLESGDFYYDNKAVYYYEASDQSWTKVDPEELKAAAQTALDSANTAVQAKDEAVEAADKAKSYTSGTDIGDYTDDPTFNVITDYVVYGRGTAGITLWKVEESVALPYTVNSTTYSHPSDDPNLRAYTATAQLYTYEETTYLTDGQVIVDAQSELTNFVVYLWDAASGERHKLDVVYDYTTNSSNQIVLLDTYPVGSKLTIVFEDIGQNSDTYIKKQEAEQLYGDHTKQANRGSANAHPASAISTTSGDTVEQALGKKATKEELSEGITESQNDIVDGSIFKGSNGEYVQNGDVVPAGTTHLRVLVGGKPTISFCFKDEVAFKNPTGLVSNLNTSTKPYSVTIGNDDLTLHSQIGEKAPYFNRQRSYSDIRAEDFDSNQAAINACPKGGSVTLYNEVLSDSLIIEKPIHIKGYGSGNPIKDITNDNFVTVNQSGTPIFIFNPIDGAVSGDYFAGQFATLGFTLEDLKLRGFGDRAGDLFHINQVNGGDYHIRSMQFINVNVDNFDVAYPFYGRCYLLKWIGGNVTDCNLGLTSTYQFEAGGQARIFGTDFIGNRQAMDIVSQTFDLGVFGSSISENGYGGIAVGHTNPLKLTSCTLEKNGDVIGGDYPSSLWIRNRGANANTDSYKHITGNKFLGSPLDFKIENNLAGFTSVIMPGIVEGNEFQGDIEFDPNLKRGMRFGNNGVSSSSTVTGVSERINASIFSWHDVDEVSQSYPVCIKGTGPTDNEIVKRNVLAGETFTINKGFRATFPVGSSTPDSAGLEVQYWDGATWQTISNLFGAGSFEEVSWKNNTGSSAIVRVFANDANTGNEYFVQFNYTVR